MIGKQVVLSYQVYQNCTVQEKKREKEKNIL